MKGRALLHHNVQLDDRATLASVPGVKDGTILRVDKQVSQVKNRMTGKKTVMSGPARLAVDEDVVESIEKSGDDEDIADTDLSNSKTALHLVKKDERANKAREQANSWGSEPQRLGHRRLQTLKNTVVSPPESAVESPTARAHVSKSTETISSHQDVMEDHDTNLLAGIDAAAAEMQILPPHSDPGLEEDVPARRCDACGRACRCGGDALTISNSVLPAEESIRGQEAASTNINSNAHLVPKRSPTCRRAESSWTGM